MESTFLQIAAGTGVGGLLGVIIFLMYREDRKTSESRWENLTGRCIECRDADLKLRRDEVKSRDEHSRVLSELSATIKNIRGREGNSD